MSRLTISEMIKKGRRNLKMATRMALHDVDIQIAAGVTDRVKCAKLRPRA